jgi:hypothetical protein
LVLDQFTQISGGLINKNKIQIYAWNIDAQVPYGIRPNSFFSPSQRLEAFQILGDANLLKIHPRGILANHNQKIKEKMESWGAIWLNPAGHLVLIKSILSSLPIFQFSSLLAPMGTKKI